MRLEDLLDPNIRVLSIKGKPGAGKTTLAIELLIKHGGGVYVSTRVSESKLVKQFPHVKDLVSSRRVRGELLDRGLVFHDHRLAMADNIIEAVSRASESMANPMIVLDSWDAIAKELDRVERLRAERSLATTAEAIGAKMVFVSEEPELTTTDYIADAIVVLKEEEVEGRRLRVLEWLKMRGKPIDVKYSLYTLYGARFTLLPRWLSVTEPVTVNSLKPRLDSQMKLPSGEAGVMKVLDPSVLLGVGFEPGRTTVIELGPTVPYVWLAQIVFQSIDLGSCDCGVVMVPNIALARFFERMLSPGERGEPSKEAELVSSRLRVGWLGASSGPFFRIDPSSVKSTLDRVIKAINELRNKAGVGKALLVVSADMLETLYSPEEIVREMFLLVSRCIEEGASLIVISKAGLRMLGELLNIADAHVKLIERSGSLLVYSIKPFSGLYGIVLEDGRLKLVPVT